MFYIYLYENRMNGKVYVGQTEDLKMRHNAHKNARDANTCIIDRAIYKYGIESFDLFTVEVWDTEDQANAAEVFWIAEMRSFLGRKNVYNISDGGSKRPPNAKGRKLSETAKQNISKAKMGVNNPNFGKHPSAETIEKLSIVRTGECNGRATLTNEKVREIRKMIANGILQTDIAKTFNVSYQIVGDIHRGKTWRNIV